MIEYYIKVENGKIYDEYNEEQVTLSETALMMYRLEEMKLGLMAKEFDPEIASSEEDKKEEKEGEDS